MPIYEYVCDTCGEPFEKIVRMSEADQLPACPHCESQVTHKKISTVFSFGAASLGVANSSGSCGSRGGFS